MSIFFVGLCAFVVWYLFFGFEYYLNGGMVGRDPWTAPFQCYWEDILWSIPGGMERKTAYIREQFAHGTYAIDGWTRDDVVANDLYEACARDVLPSALSFWIRSIIVVLVGVVIGFALWSMLKGITMLILLSLVLLVAFRWWVEAR